MEGYFSAVDWLAISGVGCWARYLGAGGNMGMLWRSWKRGVVMAVP